MHVLVFRYYQIRTVEPKNINNNNNNNNNNDDDDDDDDGNKR